MGILLELITPNPNESSRILEENGVGIKFKIHELVWSKKTYTALITSHQPIFKITKKLRKSWRKVGHVESIWKEETDRNTNTKSVQELEWGKCEETFVVGIKAKINWEDGTDNTHHNSCFYAPFLKKSDLDWDTRRRRLTERIQACEDSFT